MFQFHPSTKSPRPYARNVFLSNSLFFSAFRLIRRYIVHSLFQTAPPCCPCASTNSPCYNLFRKCRKECIITTEYGSHEFSFDHLYDIPSSLNVAPKTYYYFCFAGLTDRITSHQFHLRILQQKKVILHVLGVTPHFIIEHASQKPRTLSVTRRFVDANNLSPQMPDAGVAILGIMGVHYENTRLQRMFPKFISRASAESDNSSTYTRSAYSVIKSAVDDYAAHWRGGEIVSSTEGKGIRAKRGPRTPATSRRVHREPRTVVDAAVQALHNVSSQPALESSEGANDKIGTTQNTVSVESPSETPENLDTGNVPKAPNVNSVNSDGIQDLATELSNIEPVKIFSQSGKIPPQSPPWFESSSASNLFAKTSPSEHPSTLEEVNNIQMITVPSSFTKSFEERRARARDINCHPSKIPYLKRRDISPARGLPKTKKRRIHRSEDTSNARQHICNDKCQHSQVNEVRRGTWARAKGKRNAIQTIRGTRIGARGVLPLPVNTAWATCNSGVRSSTFPSKSTTDSDADNTVVMIAVQEPSVATTQSAATVEDSLLPTNEEPKLAIRV
jgi:hypothetical protein